MNQTSSDAERCAVSFVDDDFCETRGMSLRRTGLSASHAEYAIEGLAREARAPAGGMNLRLSRGDDAVYLINPPGLAELLSQSWKASGGAT